MSKKIRIDAGKSRKGSSWLNVPMGCLHAYRLSKFTKQRNNSRPLLIGSLGHTAQAHYHAINAIHKNGSVVIGNEIYTDASLLMDPIEAIQDQCEAEPFMLPYLDIVKKAFLGYQHAPPDLSGTPITVETEYVGVVGKKRGKLGYWLVRPDAWDMLDEAVTELPAFNGETIDVVPLGIGGHPNAHKPMYMSRRLDLETQEGKYVTVIDHKHKGNIYGKANGYNSDTGFTAIWSLAQQRWPGYLKGVEVHKISVQNGKEGKTKVQRLAYPAKALESLPFTIMHVYRTVAQYETWEKQGLLKPTEWPRTGMQQVSGGCVSVFKNPKTGWTCPYAGYCHDGQELE